MTKRTCLGDPQQPQQIRNRLLRAEFKIRGDDGPAGAPRGHPSNKSGGRPRNNSRNRGRNALLQVVAARWFPPCTPFPELRSD